MLRATCAFEENVVILLLSLRHSVPWQDTTSVTPCTLQTLWIIDVLWGRTSARGAPHITDLSGELNFWCMQKGSFWEMSRKTSPHKALNLRQPVFIEFRSCHWVTFAWLERECFIRDQRLRGCLSPYFWWTWPPTGSFSAAGPLTLSWVGSLLPTSSKFLPFPIWDLFFTLLPPFLKSRGTYSLRDSYLSAGLVELPSVFSSH